MPGASCFHGMFWRTLRIAFCASLLAAGAFATPAIVGGRRPKGASTLAYGEFPNTLNRLVERRYAQVLT